MQVVLTVPLFVTLLLLVIQFALMMQAQHVAASAASRAVAAAHTQDGTAGAGEAAARFLLDRIGSRILDHPGVQVSRGAHHTTARVHGRVLALLPGLDLHAAAAAAGPTDRWQSNRRPEGS